MTTYLFNKSNRTSLLSIKRQSTILIKYFFGSLASALQSTGTKGARSVQDKRLLVGSPYFDITPDKAAIQVYYCAGNLDNDHIDALGNALSRCWDRPVELTIIRINHLLLDRSILAQYISLNSRKYSFNRIVDFLSSNLSRPDQDNNGSVPRNSLTGIKVGLGGRLTTQRTGPRQTTQNARLGSSRQRTDFSSFTSKNKLGAFTVKV